MSSNKERILRETISYFIDTTGIPTDGFVLKVQQNAQKDMSKLEYNEWLAVKCFQLIKEHDMILSDCLKFSNLATQLKKEKEGMNITIPWQRVFCEFLRKSNIDKYELFEINDKNTPLKSLNENAVVNFMKNTEQNNFFNTWDFDESNKTLFNMLPKNIQKAITYKSPIFLSINPFLTQKYDLKNLIQNMALFGYGSSCLKNLFYGSLFRVIRFCEDYDLKDVRLGIYFPLDMFYEKEEYLDFYNYFKSYFVFHSGICFKSECLAIKADSKNNTDLIGYMLWDLNRDGKEKPVVLQEKVQHTDDTIIDGIPRLIRGQRDTLYNWCKTNIGHIGGFDIVPKYLNIQKKSDEQVQRYENVLGYQFNSQNLLRSLKKTGIYSVPVGDEFDEITSDNFCKSVASFVVRSCLSDKVKLSPIQLSNPNTTVEGYQTWLADAVSYMLFCSENMTKSYREKDFNLSNRMFPLKFSEVHKYVTDENIINDMNNNDADNLIFVNLLSEYRKNFSSAGRSLYDFGIKKLIESLIGKNRENVGYRDSLVAWDASFYQIRCIEKLFSQEEEEKYMYLVSKLKDILLNGIYKFGFICDE